MEEETTADYVDMKTQGNDEPGMNLVSAPLNGNNYLTWARAIKIALGAKEKLEFIDGTYENLQKGKKS
ncbi:UNVERIFIED_CONTAM: hypothetical protein Sindi_2001200 [Sesamum indicum]